MAEESAIFVTEGEWAGWLQWANVPDGTFFQVLGPSYSRTQSSHQAVVMLETKPIHQNLMGNLHGGLLAAVADHAYFAALNALGQGTHARGGVTMDLTMQYCGAGRHGAPLRAEVDLLQETGRLFFMRMTIHQEDRLVAASTATIKKGAKSS